MGSLEGTVFFYGPAHEPYGAFSQHFYCEFSIGGAEGVNGPQDNEGLPVFWSAEQYMMYRKAKLFEDEEVAVQISGVEGRNPRAAKALGRKVQGFDEEVWREHRHVIVEEGNYLKFSQNPELKELLLSTGEREIAEAASRDRIWGIGFGEKNAEKQRGRWGLNLLGKALIRVRSRLKEEDAAAKE